MVSDKLNLPVNRTTGLLPYEIKEGTSIFDSLGRNLKYHIKDAMLRRQVHQAKNARRMNEKKDSKGYAVEDLVFVNNPVGYKMQPKWKGPFEAVEIKGGSCILVRIDGDQCVTQNIRNVRPWAEWRRMS